MVISLDEVADEPLLSRTVILIAVAFAITALVYGAVALIVKMDDAASARQVGRGRRRRRSAAGSCARCRS